MQRLSNVWFVSGSDTVSTYNFRELLGLYCKIQLLYFTPSRGLMLASKSQNALNDSIQKVGGGDF